MLLTRISDPAGLVGAGFTDGSDPVLDKTAGSKISLTSVIIE